MLGYFLAINTPSHTFKWEILIFVLLCMVFGRSAAMAFNRYADRDVDALNDRTKSREIPAGIISPPRALIFVILNALLFIACAWMINKTCFFLSPFALIIILGYSYTKRFTWLSHFVLGLGLALAPVGAYIAVAQQFDLIPILYGLVVLLWVSGFDIIYALQDESFDISTSLRSVPVRFGVHKAMKISTGLHILCGIILILTSISTALNYGSLSWIHWVGTIIFLLLLVYQHLIVKPNDLSRVNLAFFTTNGIASLVFGSLVILDFYI
jgi:4-hydroxybenzoate polyprenyltransferase